MVGQLSVQSKAEDASCMGPVHDDVINAAAGSLENPVGNLAEILGGLKTPEIPVSSHHMHKSPELDPRLFLQQMQNYILGCNLQYCPASI